MIWDILHILLGIGVLAVMTFLMLLFAYLLDQPAGGREVE
jgi:hypothetical protein